MTTDLYFIRHAESEFIHGKEMERGITEDGLRRSRLIANRLDHVEFSAIISSHYKRAIETVEPLANKRSLTVETYKELKERPIKGLDYRMEWSKLEEAIERSFSDIDYCLRGGETTREAQKRAIPIILELLERYKGESIAIGTHGNIMTIILKYFDNSFGFDFWKNSTKPDLYKLRFSGNSLLEVNRLIEEES